jgi:hypothetical protein
LKDIKMKKIVSAIALATVLFSSTAALADGRDYRWGVDSNRHSPYYGRNYDRGYDRNYDRHRDGGVSTGGAVAIGLGALIVGALIANGNRNNRNTYQDQQQYYQPQQVCEDIIKYDYYNNPYVAGRNCWYR